LARPSAAARDGHRAKRRARTGAGAFVALPVDVLGAGTRTVVELVGHGGERMRIEVAGSVDLAGMTRAFFGRDAR
jgi:hypothetical protein